MFVIDTSDSQLNQNQCDGRARRLAKCSRVESGELVTSWRQQQSELFRLRPHSFSHHPSKWLISPMPNVSRSFFLGPFHISHREGLVVSGGEFMFHQHGSCRSAEPFQETQIVVLSSGFRHDWTSTDWIRRHSTSDVSSLETSATWERQSCSSAVESPTASKGEGNKRSDPLRYTSTMSSQIGSYVRCPGPQHPPAAGPVAFRLCSSLEPDGSLKTGAAVPARSWTEARPRRQRARQIHVQREGSGGD